MTRKKLAATALALTVPMSIGAATTAKAAPACPYVFLVPHQDDELLTMSMGIRQHINTHGASQVCVSLMTTGANSGVLDAFRAGKYGSAYTNMSDATFIRGRDLETWNALLYLGVPSSNIYIQGFTGPSTGVARIFDQNDGSSAQQAKITAWMDATMAYFGNKHFKTMSDRDDRNPGDHVSMGKALRASTRPALSKRFYYPPSGLPAPITVGTVAPTSADTTPLNKARATFNIWAAKGFYGIGYKSVKALFDKHAANSSSYQHS